MRIRAHTAIFAVCCHAMPMFRAYFFRLLFASDVFAASLYARLFDTAKRDEQRPDATETRD